jgi:phosphate/sulfate permease
MVVLAAGFGFYMAWNIGANDVANAMGTSVGSGALTMKRALIVAAVFEFGGAVLVGSHVTETVRKGMLDLELFQGRTHILMYGMLASLLAAGTWLHIASYFGWPVSTTHSIVGAIVGFGIAVGGGGVAWNKIGQIVVSWVASPLLSGVIAYITFSAIRYTMINAPNPVESTKRWAPVFIFLVLATLTHVTLFKGLPSLHLDLSFNQASVYAVCVGLAAALIGGWIIRRMPAPVAEGAAGFPLTAMSTDLREMAKRAQRMRSMAPGGVEGQIEVIQENLDSLMRIVEQSKAHSHTHEEFRFVEKVFGALQIMSACFVAFAHGANDVANAIGPVASVISLAQNREAALTETAPVALWILVLGGAGIVVGLATWGWRVIETIGRKITELTPTRGFSAEFAAAGTIVVASRLGIPISTTHTLVGAVIGVGLARGMESLNPRVVRDIITSWMITLPAGGGMAVIFFYLIKAIFETWRG